MAYLLYATSHFSFPLILLTNFSTSFSDAAKENVTPLPEYDIFKDTAFVKKGGDAKGGSSSSESNVSIFSI